MSDAALKAAPGPLDVRWALASVIVAGGAALALVIADSLLLGAGILALATLVAATLWHPQVGAVALVLTMPLDIYGRVMTSPVTVTVFQLTLLLCLFSWAVHALTDESLRPRWSWLDLGFAALLFAALWSLPLSLAPSATAVAIARIGFLVALAVFYETILRNERLTVVVVGCVVATGVAMALLALAQYYLKGFDFGNVLMIHEGGGVYIRRPSGLFDDPNYLAAFLSLAGVTAAAMLVHSRRLLAAAAWTVGGLVCAAGMFVTGSRTALVGVAVGAAVVVGLAPPRRRVVTVALAVVVVAAAVALAPASLRYRVAEALSEDPDRSTSTRTGMYESAVEIAQERWVFGTGLAAFDRAYAAHRRLEARFDIAKPHQLPIAMWAEMGVAGLIAEVVLLGGIVASFWRRRPGWSWTAAETVAAACVASLLVQSLFQYYLYLEYLWLYLALAVAATRQAQATREGG